MDYFSKANSMIVENARIGSPGNQIDWMFVNAVMVYEMADYVIDFIEKFTPNGIRELQGLHHEALDRLQILRADSARQVEYVNSNDVSQGVRKSTVDEARRRSERLDVIEREWSNYMARAERTYGQVNEVRRRLPDLKAIKENARLQIAELQEISLLRYLQESLASIQETIDALAGFELVPLTVTQVETLIGAQE